jgi:hypothetical protein
MRHATMPSTTVTVTVVTVKLLQNKPAAVAHGLPLPLNLDVDPVDSTGLVLLTESTVARPPGGLVF